MTHRMKLMSLAAAVLIGVPMLVGAAADDSGAGTVAADATVSASTESDPQVAGTAEIAVDGTAVSASTGAYTVTYTVPGQATFRTDEAAAKGAEGADLVLATEQPGANFETYATGRGAKTLITIESASSDREYSFPLDLPDGASATVQPDGSVAIYTSDGRVLGSFATPWAYDAAGTAVPTSFRVEGGALIQTVDFTEANQFPITADPDWGAEWWGVWMKFTRSETSDLANGVKGAGWVRDGAVAACGLAGPVLAIPCAAAVVASWENAGPGLAGTAASQGKCVAINYPWYGPVHQTIQDCVR